MEPESIELLEKQRDVAQLFYSKFLGIGDMEQMLRWSNELSLLNAKLKTLKEAGS